MGGARVRLRIVNFPRSRRAEARDSKTPASTPFVPMLEECTPTVTSTPTPRPSSQMTPLSESRGTATPCAKTWHPRRASAGRVAGVPTRGRGARAARRREGISVQREILLVTRGDGRAGSLPARGLQRALDEHARPSRRARRAGAHAGRAALLRPHRRAGPLSVRAGRENTLRDIASVRGVMCRRAREGAGAGGAWPRRRLRARSSGGSCGVRSRCGTSSSPTSARAALRRGAGGWRP